MNPPDEAAVALAIARVVAKKATADDPSFKRMRQFDRMMAEDAMAREMASELVEEARAAIAAYEQRSDA